MWGHLEVLNSLFSFPLQINLCLGIFLEQFLPFLHVLHYFKVDATVESFLLKKSQRGLSMDSAKGAKADSFDFVK